MPVGQQCVAHNKGQRGAAMLRLLKCSIIKKLFEVNILMDRWHRGDISIFDTKLVQSFLAGFKNSWNLGRSFSSWIPHYVVIL